MLREEMSMWRQDDYSRRSLYAVALIGRRCAECRCSFRAQRQLSRRYRPFTLTQNSVQINLYCNHQPLLERTHMMFLYV